MTPSLYSSNAVPTVSRPTYWLDGRFVGRNEASVPLSDLAVTRGYAAFDALRTYGKVPFLLNEHLQRLEESCALLSLKIPLSRKELTEVVRTTLAANEFPESLIRIFVTGGDATGFVPENRERLMVLIDEVRTYPSWHFERGVGLATSTLSRTLPRVKSTGYLAGITETIRARQQGFDEVVFCDHSGHILEGTTFSVVSVIGNELISPINDVLRGITVEHVLGLAAREGYTSRRAPISHELLEQSNEVFITSSTRELIPVNRVDHTRIADGMPGPVTRRLHECYRQSARAHCSTRS